MVESDTPLRRLPTHPRPSDTQQWCQHQRLSCSILHAEVRQSTEDRTLEFSLKRFPNCRRLLHWAESTSSSLKFRSWAFFTSTQVQLSAQRACYISTTKYIRIDSVSHFHTNSDLHLKSDQLKWTYLRFELSFSMLAPCDDNLYALTPPITRTKVHASLFAPSSRGAGLLLLFT